MSKPLKSSPPPLESKTLPSGEWLLGIDEIGKEIRRNPQGVLHAKKFDNCPVVLVDDIWTSEKGLLKEWQRQMILKKVDVTTDWEKVLKSMAGSPSADETK